MQDIPQAIVVRYADCIGNVSHDTIKEHNRLFDDNDEVWVGKFGKLVGKPYIKKCCESKTDMSLILVKKTSKGHYEAHIAGIIYAQKEQPPLRSFPAYYHSRGDVGCWFRIEKPLSLMKEHDLSRWMVKSSGFSLQDTLPVSMSGLFHAFFR